MVWCQPNPKAAGSLCPITDRYVSWQPTIIQSCHHHQHYFRCFTYSKMWILGILLLLALTTEAQCPIENDRVCSCDTSETQEIILNCRTNGLNEIPVFQNTDYTFSEVTLNGNSISSVPANAFHTVNGTPLKTKKIDLGRNEITGIDSQAFAGLGGRLETLVLHVKSMTTFPTQTLQSLTNLKTLEMDGFDMTSLPNNALTNLDKIEVLSLTGSKLSSLSASDLQSQRNSLKELDLEKNSFTSVPKDALKDITNLSKLQMSSNKITNLPSRAFAGLNSIKYLDLNQNGFNSVAPDAFDGLSGSLKELKLSYTNFYSTNLHSLTSLNQLEVLDLNNNQINTFPTNVFEGMDSLRDLNLHGCKMTNLNSNSFNGLGQSLQELDLVSNSITRIESNSFKSLTKLKQLHLDGQKLSSTLNSRTFEGLDNLEFLSMSGIEFNTENWQSIKDLSGLITLKLNVNQINSIPQGVLGKLNQLQTLELSGNSIPSIPPEALSGLRFSLREINLNSNNLATLHECLFYGFNQLETIKLDNNPLQCDCQIKWLRTWLDKYTATQKKTYRWTCSSPSSHQGSYLRDINVDDLICNDQPEIIDCQSFITTTTPDTIPSSTAPLSSTLQGDVPILVTISNITDTTFMVSWVLSQAQDVGGFMVEVSQIPLNELIHQEILGAETTDTLVSGLEASTDYLTCVVIIHSPSSTNPDEEPPEEQGCQDVTTAAKTSPSVGADENLALILGCVVGALCFIILVALIIYCIKRYNRHADPFYYENKQATKFPTRNEMPAMGYNSKCFSKPKAGLSASMNSLDLEKKLKGFSPEERDRILNLLTTSGASTLSRISNASNGRYLHEHLPHHGGPSNYPPEQYLNQMGLPGPQEENPYLEPYEYIPADQVTEYNYITADQVKCDDIKPDSPPPLPGEGPQEENPYLEPYEYIPADQVIKYNYITADQVKCDDMKPDSPPPLPGEGPQEENPYLEPYEYIPTDQVKCDDIKPESLPPLPVTTRIFLIGDSDSTQTVAN